LYVFRCVDDGYCSLEQADLIQQYVEKKLAKLYKIDETIGKSLLKTDESEDEFDEEDPKGRKAMIISDDDENSRSPTNGITNRPTIGSENSLTTEITNSNKHLSSKNDDNAALSPSLNSNNRLSPSLSLPSPSKEHLSPGEITKPMSPSSLSEASPILD